MKKEAILKFYLNFRLYIFPAVVAVSCLILIIFVIYPQTVKLVQNQKVQGELKEKSEFLEAKATTLENLDEEDLSTKLGYVLTAFPTEHDFGNIVGLLQEIARDNGFTISTLSVQPGSQDSGSSQKYGVKLEAVGSEDLLPRFITSIESSVRIMKVDAIEVTPARAGGAASISLDVAVLYAQAPSSFGGPGSPLPEVSKEDETLIVTLSTFSIPGSLAQPISAQPRGKTNPFE